MPQQRTAASRRHSRRSVVLGAAGVTAAMVTGASDRETHAQSPIDATIRGIYLNPLAVNMTGAQDLLAMIERTELNALVIDAKEDGIYVPTSADLFVAAAEQNEEVMDISALLPQARERGVYTIARVVCFRDLYLAAKRPDLAVLDVNTGEPWESYDGLRWLNPMQQETWDAYADFSLELAELGFDEIQYDYVRFPSDGDLENMDFGVELTEAIRVNTIVGFLTHCRDRLANTEVKTSADIFGYTLLIDDIGIGQNAARIAAVTDYVSPMVYPSHFPDASIDVPGQPNDFPYETIAISLEAGASRVPPARMRPWLQDFSLAGMSSYGPAEVRAQIDATEAAGAGGWLLWAADSVFTEAALLPAEA